MTTTARTTAPATSRTAALALLADVVAVAVFVLIGRRSHDETSALLGFLHTAWPFLAGLGVGWWSLRAWRRPTRLWPEAVIIWLITVVVGNLARVLSGQGTALSFVIVTLVVLAAFLLGWRAVFAAVQRRRATTGK
ncbi:MAG: DUF3054 domain-containing protein [Mycobacteriaceae bacterium]